MWKRENSLSKKGQSPYIFEEIDSYASLPLPIIEEA